MSRSAVISMNAPATFWPGAVARTQAWSIFTSPAQDQTGQARAASNRKTQGWRYVRMGDVTEVGKGLPGVHTQCMQDLLGIDRGRDIMDAHDRRAFECGQRGRRDTGDQPFRRPLVGARAEH